MTSCSGVGQSKETWVRFSLGQKCTVGSCRNERQQHKLSELKKDGFPKNLFLKEIAGLYIGLYIDLQIHLKGGWTF